MPSMRNVSNNGILALDTGREPSYILVEVWEWKDLPKVFKSLPGLADLHVAGNLPFTAFTLKVAGEVILSIKVHPNV